MKQFFKNLDLTFTAAVLALEVLVAVSLVLAAVVFLIWWEIDLWNECRADHSWLYCVRVLHH